MLFLTVELEQNAEITILPARDNTAWVQDQAGASWGISRGV